MRHREPKYKCHISLAYERRYQAAFMRFIYLSARRLLENLYAEWHFSAGGQRVCGRHRRIWSVAMRIRWRTANCGFQQACSGELSCWTLSCWPLDLRCSPQTLAIPMRASGFERATVAVLENISKEHGHDVRLHLGGPRFRRF